MKISKVDTFKPVTITLETRAELEALKEIVDYMGTDGNALRAHVSYYHNLHIDYLSSSAKSIRTNLRNKL